jgi:hypothetical protein
MVPSLVSLVRRGVLFVDANLVAVVIWTLRSLVDLEYPSSRPHQKKVLHHSYFYPVALPKGDRRPNPPWIHKPNSNLGAHTSAQ